MPCIDWHRSLSLITRCASGPVAPLVNPPCFMYLTEFKSSIDLELVQHTDYRRNHTKYVAPRRGFQLCLGRDHMALTDGQCAIVPCSSREGGLRIRPSSIKSSESVDRTRTRFLPPVVHKETEIGSDSECRLPMGISPKLNNSAEDSCFDIRLK